MKKITLLIITLVLTVNLLSQPWQPFYKDKIANYKHSGSSSITNTIWITDTIFSFDTVVFFNTIVIQSLEDPNYFIRNKEQFLQKKMLIKGNGVYTFTDPRTFHLNTNAKTGESWAFVDDSLTAYVERIEDSLVFGISDSVKLITLKKEGIPINKRIVLSKKFGILEFPDFQTDHKFELISFQGDSLGEDIVNFYDVFNFNVGDVFQYSHYEVDPSVGDIATYIKKYTISSKIAEDSLFKYTINGIESGSVYNVFDHTTYSYAYTFIRALNYNYSNSHFVNRFPNEFLIMPNCWSYVSIDENVYTTITLGINSNELKYKRIGLSMNQSKGKLFYLEELNSDTLVQCDQDFYDAEGTVGITAIETLGYTSYRLEWWEGEKTYYLSGYIKDGDTIGIITEDDILLSDNFNNGRATNAPMIFPSPFHRILTIKWNEPVSEKWKIIFFDLNGKVVAMFESNQQHFEANLTHLQPGLYLYKIIDSENLITIGKILKQ